MKTVVEHLENLIRIPSVSSLSNRPIVEYAARVLQGAHWDTRLMTYADAAGLEKVNLIAAPDGQDPEDPEADLVFMCHTDTVPYAADWTRALEPFVTDGLLYGCGACDVKGFLACLLTAISEVNPAELQRGLRLVLTADEEIGCLGAKRLIAAELIKPRRIVIGEPTSLHPARAGKGYCLAEITIVGEEAHSAHPQQGKSAIYGAARLITAIEELSTQFATKQNDFFTPGYTTINIGTVMGGTAKNVVPGQCKFQVEWRPLPGESSNSVLQSITSIAEQMKDADPTFRFEIKGLRQQAGFETAEDAHLVRAIEALTQRSATSIPFGSEASVFASVANEVVVFGPGDMRTAHSRRECVPLSELHEAVLCIKSLMQNV
ncbi:acetylornithine deacetylase [Terriglobus albidus]|uniref:Acetylornithine deacetylase n=1 Tax=Terriglobus albidus TaxID=1592106 RepID=A0A5B9EDK5_9BACT|nr:acetylornithine deacetylase [Terriglobus albidus]QEE30092.1 acetylornithine deacetylase [Terriglobus albidus]